MSSVVVPCATSSSIRSHIPSRLAGSRPVVGSSRNSTFGRGDQAHRDVDPAAHAAGEALDDAVGRLVELERGEQLRGALAAPAACRHPEEPADELEVLARRSAARRRRRTDRSARSAPALVPGSAATSIPSIVARPPSARVSVVRMRTAVVLPAPFGPSIARTVPASTAKLEPAQRVRLAEALLESDRFDGGHGASASCSRRVESASLRETLRVGRRIEQYSCGVRPSGRRRPSRPAPTGTAHVGHHARTSSGGAARRVCAERFAAVAASPPTQRARGGSRRARGRTSVRS